MNNLTIIKHNGQFAVDSREVAAMVEMRHADLLEKINGYIQYLTNGKFRSLDFFIPSNYLDAKGEERPCYLITRKGCDMIANKMTGEKGVLFTAAYVTKFEEMEKQLQQPYQLPQSYSEALRALADEVERREKLEAENRKMLPKAQSYDSLINADGLYEMSNVAKILNYEGVGPRNIFKVLIAEEVFYYKGHGKTKKYYVYQQYLTRGYFQEKTTTIPMGENEKIYTQIFATPKGLDWLDKFLSERGYKKNSQ